MKRRLIPALIFLACAGLLGYGLYLQYVEYLEPCPLCLAQRLAYIFCGAIALLAALHAPGRLGTRIYAALLMLGAGAGAALAGRQIWLQHLPPDQVPECGPGLEMWIQTLPLTEVLMKVLKGTGDCAEVVWTFLGLSIPEWSLLMFIAIFLLAVIHLRINRSV